MIVLRPWTSADREPTLAVFDSNMPRYFKPFERPLYEEYLASLPREDMPYFVLEQAGVVVGAGGVALSEAKDARMCWGIVHQDLHGQGLGRALLLFRILAGAAKGAVTSSLDTIPEVAPFFVRHGFAITGEVENGYGPGLHRRDLAITLDEKALTTLRALYESAARSRITLAPGLSV